MAVSKAIVPLLKGDAASSIQQTLKVSQIKPYTKEERDRTRRAISQILERKKQTHVALK